MNKLVMLLFCFAYLSCSESKTVPVDRHVEEFIKLFDEVWCRFGSLEGLGAGNYWEFVGVSEKGAVVFLRFKEGNSNCSSYRYGIYSYDSIVFSGDGHSYERNEIASYTGCEWEKLALTKANLNSIIETESPVDIESIYRVISEQRKKAR